MYPYTCVVVVVRDCDTVVLCVCAVVMLGMLCIVLMGDGSWSVGLCVPTLIAGEGNLI